MTRKRSHNSPAHIYRGGTSAPKPVPDGSAKCPLCHKVGKLTDSRRIRAHRDNGGAPCPGGGMVIIDRAKP